MKFTLVGSKMVEEPNKFIEWLNGIGDGFIEKEVELILKPVGAFLKECFIMGWHWFCFSLPDIMGFLTITAGALIIIGAMIDKGSMMKVMGWFAGAFILAWCILAGRGI